MRTNVIMKLNNLRSMLTAMAIGIAIMAAAANQAVTTLPVKTISGHEYYYYEVLPKETLFSLSHKLGISQDMIVSFNPGVADGLKAHTMLYFPVEAFAHSNRQHTAATTHLVKKQETIYGLAHQYGISEAELIAANPQLKDGLKAGTIITIPDACEPPISGQEASPSAAPSPADRIRHAMGQGREPEAETGPDAEEQVVLEVEVERPQAADIAIMLPFMLSADKPTKQSRLYTEFYKGFLLAVDTLRKTDKLPITLRVYDTAGSADTIKKILTRPELADVSLIIAPDSQQGLQLIGDFAKSHNILVLNTFVPRDDSYLTNPVMLQAGTPTELMNSLAVDAFMREFDGYTPVFLMHSGIKQDKSQFTDALKTKLSGAGIIYETISYSSKLSSSDFASLKPDVNYVFVPLHSSQKELNLILPALSERKDATRYPVEMALFGYPEWITFKGSTLQGMHHVETTVFSRFFNDSEDSASQGVDASFRHWYGQPMMTAAPRQGLLGYDTAMYLLRSLSMPVSFPTETPRYNGVQNGFNFVSQGNGAGFCNDVVYFVTFKPGTLIDRRIVR